MGEQTGGCIYIETEVEGKKLEAMVDTGANTVSMEKELAAAICLPYKKEKGHVKGVNTKSLLIHGAARDANRQIGHGKVRST